MNNSTSWGRSSKLSWFLWVGISDWERFYFDTKKIIWKKRCESTRYCIIGSSGKSYISTYRSLNHTSRDPWSYFPDTIRSTVQAIWSSIGAVMKCMKSSVCCQKDPLKEILIKKDPLNRDPCLQGSSQQGSLFTRNLSTRIRFFFLFTRILLSLDKDFNQKGSSIRADDKSKTFQ